MNTDNIEEIYQVVKYSFSKFDVFNEAEAHNIALRFFEKYNKNYTIKQMYLEYDFIEEKYNVYIAY